MTGQQVYQAQQDLARMEEDSPFRYAQASLVAKAQAEIGGPVYRIPLANVDHLKHEIEIKVNKRAAKLQLPPVQVIELEQEIIESPDYERRQADGSPGVKKHTWQYIAIKGETPKVAGYSFIATLQHEEAGNIIRQIPVLRLDGEPVELPNLISYRHVDPECEQCGLRRHRKDTYLVWNQEDDSIMQVGSNCLGDFLGAADPQRYASYAEYLRDFLVGLGDNPDAEEGYYGPRLEREFEMVEYLSSVARMIRANGWVPTSSYDGNPTKAQAWENLVNYGKKDRGVPLWIDIEEQDVKLAEETLDWLLTDLAERNDLNDYEWNLVTAAKAKGVTYRTTGIIASAVRAYDRERENKLRREKQAAKNAVKGHVGQIGERSEHNVTLMKTVPIEDRYADRYADDQTKPLYIFEDEAGNEIKWFSSRWLDGIFKNGESYKISVKVKSHEDNAKFGKSTQVTHVKVVS